MRVSNSFVSRMIANGYIVYKRSRCFFKLRLLFALVSVCICICIPIESSLLHICIQIRRGQWEIDMGRIWYVSLSLSAQVVCSCSRCVIERCSVQFRRIAFVRIGDRGGQGWCKIVNMYYETLGISESRYVDGKGVGKNQRSANPTRISGVTNEESID